MAKRVALFDLDGTLADYDKKLKHDLQRVASPDDPELEDTHHNLPTHIEARRQMITSQVGWWLTLERFQLGWDILNEIQKLDYTIVILSKGPKTKPSAWSEKIQWCNEHLSEVVEGVTITHDKGLVYGKILVDDYPAYITKWLEWRPRGLVVMPAHEHNKDFVHPNVIRYDGSNLEEVRARLKAH